MTGGTRAGTRDGAEVSWRSPTLLVIVASACMAPLDVPLVSPALPTIRDAFGVTDAAAGLVITAYAVPALVAAPAIGMLADRFGRRRVLVVSLVAYGGFGVSILAAPTFEAVLALRFAQGAAGGSIIASLALTLVGDRYRGTARSAAMGVTASVQSLAVAAYPAVGGLLADVAWNAPFAVYGVSVLVGLGALAGLSPAPVERGTTGLDYLRGALGAVPPRRGLVTYAAVFGGFSLFFGGVLTAVPFLLGSAFGLSSGRIGTLLTTALLVTAAVAWANGRIARRLSDPAIVALGFVFYGAGLAAAWAAPSPTTLVAALAVFGVGHGLAVPSLGTLLAGLAPDRFRAGVMSLRTSVLVGSQAAGPALFTTLGAAVGYRPLLLAAGAAAVAVGGAALALVGPARA